MADQSQENCNEQMFSQVASNEVNDEFLLATKRILLFGDVNESLSTHAIVCLQKLAMCDPKIPINIYINSDGGQTDDGYAIVDQMLLMAPQVIRTIVLGRAYSMGAVIAGYGTPGHRYITPNSSCMLHNVSYGLESDNPEVHSKTTEFVRKDWGNKLEDLAKRMGKTKKDLAQLMDKGFWLSSKEAIKHGLCDKIWTPKDEQEINESCRNYANNSDEKLDHIGEILAAITEGIRSGRDFSVQGDQ